MDGCTFKHHTKLHGAPPIFAKPTESSASKSLSEAGATTTPFSGHCSREPTDVLLCVLPIRISAKGKSVDTLALLDNGSQLSLIRKGVAKKLDLRGQKEDPSFGNFHGFDPKIPVTRVKFLISSFENSCSFSVNEAYAIETLNINTNSMDAESLKRNYGHLSDLPLPYTDKRDVTVLIGMNIRGAHEVFDSRKQLN